MTVPSKVRITPGRPDDPASGCTRFTCTSSVVMGGRASSPACAPETRFQSRRGPGQPAAPGRWAIQTTDVHPGAWPTPRRPDAAGLPVHIRNGNRSSDAATPAPRCPQGTRDPRHVARTGRTEGVLSWPARRTVTSASGDAASIDHRHAGSHGRRFPLGVPSRGVCAREALGSPGPGLCMPRRARYGAMSWPWQGIAMGMMERIRVMLGTRRGIECGHAFKDTCLKHAHTSQDAQHTRTHACRTGQPFRAPQAREAGTPCGAAHTHASLWRHPFARFLQLPLYPGRHRCTSGIQ